MNISLDDIRSKAPEGATHYRKWWAEISDTDYIIYFKVEDGKVFDIFHGKWETSLYTIDQIKPL